MEIRRFGWRRGDYAMQKFFCGMSWEGGLTQVVVYQVVANEIDRCGFMQRMQMGATKLRWRRAYLDGTGNSCPAAFSPSSGEKGRGNEHSQREMLFHHAHIDGIGAVDWPCLSKSG
jgi:hypothetical protein